MTVDPDALYQSYDKGLYKLTGSEQSDSIMDMIQADPSVNNSANVTVSASDLGSGVDTSTAIQTTGSFQAGKKLYDNTVPGFILGVDPKDGNAKFFIGNSTNYMQWDGTSFIVKATSSNLQIYQAVVNSDGTGDYTTVSAALVAGKSRILVRNGTYNSEPAWNITTDNTIIECESYGGAVISFATGDPNVTVNAQSVTLNNLKLIAYHTSSQTLIKFGASAVRPFITNCLLRNANGKVFDGSTAGGTLYATIQNCFMDATSLDNASNYWAYYSLTNCVVFNCTVDFGSYGGLVTAVDTCATSNFYTCSFLKSGASDIKILSSATTTFVSCIFQISGLTAAANFDTCYMHNNTGGAISTFFVTLTNIQTRLNNCTIDIAGTTGQPLYINAANIQCNNNYIVGGLQIYLQNGAVTINAISFCNNTWATSYTAAAADITIAASAARTLVVGNIVRASGSGFTPTITDGGTADTVANNILTTA